jgi:hypothetical protein
MRAYYLIVKFTVSQGYVRESMCCFASLVRPPRRREPGKGITWLQRAAVLAEIPETLISSPFTEFPNLILH